MSNISYIKLSSSTEEPNHPIKDSNALREITICINQNNTDGVTDTNTISAAGNLKLSTTTGNIVNIDLNSILFKENKAVKFADSDSEASNSDYKYIYKKDGEYYIKDGDVNEKIISFEIKPEEDTSINIDSIFKYSNLAEFKTDFDNKAINNKYYINDDYYITATDGNYYIVSGETQTKIDNINTVDKLL